MTEWKEVKLENILDKITKGTTPPKGVGFVVKGVNYIKSDAIGYDGRISEEKFVQIDFKTHEKFKRSQLEENDILFSMAGAYLGKNALVKKEMLPANTNQALAILRLNKSLALPRYINYYLIQPKMIDYINNMSGQSAQPNINFQEISSLELLLPPLKEQKIISESLTSLDDKIDLLQRQNKILEELAQTLFRQWFIEEANDEWKEYEIRDFATHKKISIKPAENPNDSFLHFSLPAFDTNKEPNIELGSDIKSNKYQVESFSILMSKLNPKTPRIWDIYFEPNENSICSTEFQVVQPNNKSLFPFISTLLKSPKVTGELAMSASGTSGSHQRVKPEDIFNISFATPSIDRMKEFSELLEPNYLKQMKNQNQIQTLENMRDTLLPKLMSGEVKIQQVKEVTCK